MKLKQKRRASPYEYYALTALVGLLTTYVGWYLIMSGVHVLLLYLCAINTVTLLLYVWDKMSAIVNGREGALEYKALSDAALLRVPERVLHILALLGGSPMALIAQKVFRHKTRKSGFLLWYWVIVVMQVLLLLAFLW